MRELLGRLLIRTIPLAVWRLERLALEFPEINFVALDAVTTNANSNFVLDVARRTPNIFFDTAHVRSAVYIRRFVESVGSHRLVFGSTFYSYPASYEQCATLEEVRSAQISTEDMKNILWLNARRLFGLE